MLPVAAVAVLFTLCTGLDAGVPANSAESINKTNRSGRWFGDNDPEVSVQLGYYASPDTPVYSIDNPDGKRKDKSKYNVPTSFDDFMPDNKEDKKSRYNYPKAGPTNNDWKGDADYAAAPWMFPTEMLDMINAMKGDDDQPTGLFAKLKAEPVAFILATLIPLTILMMAVLPPILNFFSNGGMGQNIVTTTATGNEGARQLRRSDEPAFVASILEAIEGFGGRGSDPTICWQKRVCEVAKRVNGTEYKSLQGKLREVFTYIDESWLGRLGMRDFVEAVSDGKCENIRCPDQPSKYLLHDELDAKKRSARG